MILKLTEAELAEMGFVPRTTARRTLYHHSTVVFGKESGRAFVNCPKDLDVVEAYPQTKEDLLTLIRLFTPPQEVKCA